MLVTLLVLKCETSKVKFGFEYPQLVNISSIVVTFDVSKLFKFKLNNGLLVPAKANIDVI